MAGGTNESVKGGGFKVARLFFNDGRCNFGAAGAPTNAVTGAGFAGIGSLYVNISTGDQYYNTGTKASPTWSAYSLGATTNVQATTSVSVGGTGVAGAAAVQTEKTKAVTAFSDTVAKATFTVTVPNAKHAAALEVTVLAALGAGGTIGAGEGTFASKYLMALARTAGVNVVVGVDAVHADIEAHVAGGDSVASAVVTASAITGAVGASNTFTINVAITKAGGASDNHTAVVSVRVINQNATGVTIA